MKKKLSFYDREERNGVFLLSLMMTLFCMFIFLQKTMIAQASTLTIKEYTNVVEPRNQVNTVAAEGSSTQILKGTKENNSYKNGANQKAGYVVAKKDTIKSTEASKEEKTEQIASSTSLGNSKSPKEFIDQDLPKTYKQKTWNNSKQFKRKESSPISMNSADAEEWQKLRGIGPKFSERIIKYKNWLGGFHDKNQIKEVYGITDSLYQTLEPFLILDANISEIYINSVDVKSLAGHPYMSWKDSKKILKYRNHHGPFKSEDDFGKIIGLDATQMEKIYPYFNYEVAIDQASDAAEADKS